MTAYNSFDLDFATLNDNAKLHRQHLDNIQYVSGATRMTDFMNVKTVTDYNYEIVWASNSVSDVYSGSSKFVRWVLGKLQLKYTLNSGKRACFVIYNHKHKNSTDTEKRVLLLGKTNDAITITFPDNYTSNGAKCDGTIYYNNGSFREYYMGQLTDDNGLNSVNTALSKSGTAQDYVNSLLLENDDEKTRLLTLAGLYYRSDGGGYGSSSLSCGVPSSASTLANPYLFGFNKLPEGIPVFDLSDTNAVANVKAYLDNGDSSHSVDPFDPNNPTIVQVTDYKTNFKVSITPTSAKNGVKVSVIAYNAQYIAGGDNVAGTCCLHGESKLGTETSYNGIGNNSLPKYPQITKTFDLIVDSSSNRWIYFVFRNVDDVNSHSSWFGVDLIYSDKSATHCKIALVTGGDAINSGSSCTRSSITDGYRYTRTATGEYVDVVFRAFDMDDLNDPYNDDDDTENTESGSDVDSGVGGKGLRTYAISNTQFEDINTALWSTDWTTVFKSNTINPLNCVMACKSIPFTASAVSGGVVTIANLNTNVSANYVTPIKTFSCGSLSLDKYNKDFTDLTQTKVRVYMPYIGWRELPAIEVIGRVAVPKCGLVAHNKTLAFKYIVDFVDGNCRCVISVNGTERYYFDGNCSIDVPVTSDNHTTAVGNAIKAGVQTVMSIGAGVASGVAGNAVGAVGGAISALQSAPNVIPTYQYSATSSPSGYIDASMPQKIIIVIERPVYTVPDNYAHTAGRPCALTLSLGSLTGYTKCANVDISGVSGSDRQRSEVKQLLESGVYL